MSLQVSIVALKNDEIRIVQSSMLGSILSNILLVLGCCFFAGGIKFSQQKFNDVVASTMSSLMVVSTASLIIPATLYAVMKGTNADQDNNILMLSHGTAVILLLLYVLYLFFQLRTHSEFFDAEGEGEENGEQEEGRVLSPTAAGVALVLITVLVAVCAEYLVDSIDSIVQTAHISKTFIGLVLLPIVGNAAEHVTAVVVALKDKMDLAIGVAIGSSMQIALLVTPFLVILGWIMDKPMTLRFETFETVVFFLSVLITSYVIAVSLPSSLEPLFQRKLTIVQDGKSNYLEGAMLLGMYTIIALAFVSLLSPAIYILSSCLQFPVCIPGRRFGIRTQSAVIAARRVVIAETFNLTNLCKRAIVYKCVTALANNNETNEPLLQPTSFLRRLSQRSAFSTIGARDLDHAVVSPEPCIESTFPQAHMTARSRIRYEQADVGQTSRSIVLVK